MSGAPGGGGRRAGLLRGLPAPQPDTAPLPPAAPAAPGVRLYAGVPYADLPGRRPPELDLWLPERAAPRSARRPVILLVHGGSWRRGRRQDFGPAFRERPDGSPGLFARLARDGFAVVSADYRLSGEAPFPAALDDLRSALRWLALRADELGVDPDRITVWGESAGGHLASLLALTAAEPPFPAAAIAWYGPAELAGPVRGFDPADPATPEALLLGAAPTEVPELAGAASPVARVHPDAPPFMLVHGTADSVVPVEHSELLADRLRAAGVAVELLLVPGAEHGWYGLPGDRVDELVAAALAFADAAGR